MYAALLCFNKAWSIVNGIVHMRACKFMRVNVGVLELSTMALTTQDIAESIVFAFRDLSDSSNRARCFGRCGIRIS